MNNSTADRRSPLGLVKASLVCTRALNGGGRGVPSPPDRLVKAVSATDSGGITRTYRSAQNWEGNFWTRKKWLQTQWLPPGLAVGDFVPGRPGAVLSRSA